MNNRYFMENFNGETFETAYVNKELQIGDKIQPIHLGDVIVCLNLLYNRALNTNVPIKIYGPTWISELFDIFEYKKIYYVGNYTHHLKTNMSFMNLFPRVNFGALKDNKSNCGFMEHNCFCNLSNPKIVKYEKFHLPNSKIKKEIIDNKTYFQFDSRSLQDISNKSLLSKNQCLNFIDNFKSNNKIFGIGGKETIKYLDYEFCLGNLKQIATNLCNGSLFLGVDSGISHLAGTLKIPSKIICLFDTEPRVSEIVQMYNIFYPDTVIYKKNEFFFGDKVCYFPLL